MSEQLDFRQTIREDAQRTDHTPWILQAMAECFRYRFDGTIDQWADGKLKIPSSARCPTYIAEESPWLVEPMRALSDPKVRRVDVRGPAGSAKSLIGEIHIGYVIENEPGLYYYVWQSDSDAKDAMEDRVLPMIEENEFLATRLPTEPNKKRQCKIVFPTMPFYALGANMNNAQSKRARYVTMEEPHLYAPGMMSAFEKRTEGVRGAKILTLSTGSILGDESDKAYNEGSCEEWHVSCPLCSHEQPLLDTRDRLRSERTAETVDAEGGIIWHKLLPTVRYNCVQCGGDWPTDEAFRRKQAQGGRYIATNLNAPADHRSFHWNAIAVHWISLPRLVEEKLKASYAARRGSTELLKDYIQKRKGDPWDEAPPDEGGMDSTKMMGAYVASDHLAPTPDELARFCTVDNQHGRSSKGEGAHRWVLVRAYFPNECRLLFAERVTTWEDVEDVRLRFQVQPSRTLVDCAFDTQAVQAQCVRFGWQALWGDTNRREGFPHRELVLNQWIVRIYPFSTMQLGTVGHGMGGVTRQARYFFWAHNVVKTLHHRLKGRMVTYAWTVPQDCPEAYFEHVKNEFKRQELDSAGNKIWRWYNPPSKPNHLLDCDQMNLVAALMDPRIRSILLSTHEQSIQTPSANETNGGAEAPRHEVLPEGAVPEERSSPS